MRFLEPPKLVIFTLANGIRLAVMERGTHLAIYTPDDDEVFVQHVLDDSITGQAAINIVPENLASDYFQGRGEMK